MCCSTWDCSRSFDISRPRSGGWRCTTTRRASSGRSAAPDRICAWTSANSVRPTSARRSWRWLSSAASRARRRPRGLRRWLPSPHTISPSMSARPRRKIARDRAERRLERNGPRRAGPVGTHTRRTSMSSDPIRGKTLRWTYEDGPMAGKQFEHRFSNDGTVAWREIGGQKPDQRRQAGNGSTTEPSAKYEVARVNDDVYAVSYLSSSGYTLTTV